MEAQAAPPHCEKTVIFWILRNIVFRDIRKGGVAVEQEKQELQVQCAFAEKGGSLENVLKECFQIFLYKELQKNAQS